MSLRETDLIHAPQHSLPTNQLCDYTATVSLRTYRSAPLRLIMKSQREAPIGATATSSNCLGGGLESSDMPRGGRVCQADGQPQAKIGRSD